MNRNQKRIKNQSNTTNEVSYAILQQPTNAAFIPAETMETNAEKTSERQTSTTVYAQSKLAENQKAKRPETTPYTFKVVESQTVGLVTQCL